MLGADRLCFVRYLGVEELPCEDKVVVEGSYS